MPFFGCPWCTGTEMVREGYFGSKIVAHYSMIYLVASTWS